VKLPGIFILAVVGLYLLRKREWRGLAQGLAVSGALLLALKVALFPTTEALMSLTNPASDTKNSLHEVLLDLGGRLSNWLDAPMDYETLFALDRRIFAVLFIGFCLWRSWRIMQIGLTGPTGQRMDLQTVITEQAYILLALLIGYTTWFFPWYVAWLIPLAALVESTRLRWVIVIFSWTTMALYAFPNYLTEQAPLHWLWALLRLAIAHGVPLALIVRIAVKSGRRRVNDLVLPPQAAEQAPD
jgi:hypothetical protein